MTITKENYKSLKDRVEGHRLEELALTDTYTALCYLTHRQADERDQGNVEASEWTRIQVNIVKERQRALLAERGIYVLRG